MHLPKALQSSICDVVWPTGKENKGGLAPGREPIKTFDKLSLRYKGFELLFHSTVGHNIQGTHIHATHLLPLIHLALGPQFRDITIDDFMMLPLITPSRTCDR